MSEEVGDIPPSAPPTYTRLPHRVRVKNGEAEGAIVAFRVSSSLSPHSGIPPCIGSR